MKTICFSALLLAILVSCGGGGGGSSLPSAPTFNDGRVVIGGGNNTTDNASEIGSLTISATPDNLTVLGTTSIAVTLKDSKGANVANGTTVAFAIDNPALGSITSQATTYNGTATATFTANNKPGFASITASAGGLSVSVRIIISAAATGSIEFVSATPSAIGIKGSGQTETSIIRFIVKDINGNAVSDGITVNFTMNGPSGGRQPADGGEYIGDIDTTPATASASTANGYADVILHSGRVSGPINVIATVAGTTPALSTASSTMSIGGGIPSADHFNLASDKLNLAGFAISGEKATISAYMADRFGNYNVLTGTTVSFYTEAGAIGSSAVTDASGYTSVTFRTQAPLPAKVAITGPELTLINNLNTKYSLTIPTDGSVTPGRGWVTILATAQGEESFEDKNGNGAYDSGEKFTDMGEPFIDKNDDGCWNDGANKHCFNSSGSETITPSTDQFEEYIDSNGNGKYDGPNGRWDGQGCIVAGCQNTKMIWKSLKLLTSDAIDNNYFTIKPKTFSIANGKSQTFEVLIADGNLNKPIGGTTVKVKATTASSTAATGTLSGTTNYTVLDDSVLGPLEISFTLSDSDPSAAVPTPVTITVTVEHPKLGSWELSVPGTIE